MNKPLLSGEVHQITDKVMLDDGTTEEPLAFEVVLKPALLRASVEGRLHPGLAGELGLPTGHFLCPTCGMRHNTEHESAVCCSAEGWRQSSW